MITPIGLSPNIERDDVTRAWAALFSPNIWYQNTEKRNIHVWFQSRFHTDYVYTFATGRSALTALLSAMHIGVGDEVIMQAFTCMVVPNAIVFAGATPVYADIDASGNCDPKDIERKITPKTKAIIVQHTFGIPADMDAIMKIARVHHIRVIEDCAHSLGAMYKDKQTGTFGDAAFFSFGRDKCVSSVFGGAVIVRSEIVAKQLRVLESEAIQPSRFWIFQQLVHPIITWMILPIYRCGIGKAVLVFFQKLHVVSFPVLASERQGVQPKRYRMQYPNALALLLATQLLKLDRYTETRRHVAMLYRNAFRNHPDITMLADREGSCPLRFGIRVRHQTRVLRYAKQHGFILGNWYHAVIDPEGSNLKRAQYIMGSCREAEKLAGEIINLPTRISDADAKQIVSIILQAVKNQ